MKCLPPLRAFMRILSLSIITTFILIHPLQAQWTERAKGLDGGCIKALLKYNNYLFAGTLDGGIYRSNNQGKSWTEANDGFWARDAFSFAVKSNIIFVASGGGIFKSADDGSSWQETGLANKGNTDVVCTNSSYVFAYKSGDGVYRSADNGTTWKKINDGLADASVLDILANDAYVFAATNKGMFRSDDNGTTWKAINTGLSGTYVDIITAMGADLYIGLSNGLYRSSDNGDHWTNLSAGFKKYVLSLCASGSILYAGALSEGVFRSVDKGVTWSSVNSGITDYYTNVLLADGADIFLGTWDGGVYHSDDGVIWQPSSGGIHNLVVDVVYPHDAYLFAGTRKGLFRSLIVGDDHWYPINSNLSADAQDINGLMYKDNKLYAATADGLYASVNNGDAWTLIDFGVSHPGVLNIGITAKGVLYITVLDHGVYRSSDGAKWELLSDGIPTLGISFSGIAIQSDDVYVSMFENGVYRLSSSTQKWVAVNQGIETFDIRCLGVDDGVILAGTNQHGFFRSEDQGENWKDANNGLSSSFATGIASNSLGLFAADVGAIYRSLDKGKSWTTVTYDIFDVRSIAIDDNFLYAGNVGGVWIAPTSAASITTAVDEVDKQQVVIMPNPAKHKTQLYFSSGDGCSVQYTLTNATGANIMQGVAVTRDNTIDIDLKNLSPGVYFIRAAMCDKKVSTQRIVVE